MSKIVQPIPCGHCVCGDHYLCPVERCACADQAHEPDEALAARMQITLRPDLAPWARRAPAEAAARWRRNNAAQAAKRTAAVR